MRNMKPGDKLADAIVNVIKSSAEPLETKEVHVKVVEVLKEDVSRSRLVYRLNDLRGQGAIAGKTVGSGKGVWIWWNKKEE
jgi:hypothetical protein